MEFIDNKENEGKLVFEKKKIEKRIEKRMGTYSQSEMTMNVSSQTFTAAL